VRALAADVMLRRRRVSCVVRFGVRFSGLASDVIEGHAWVECHTSRIGIDGQSEFSVLTR
jgi:Transglutaminase-like superfamily